MTEIKKELLLLIEGEKYTSTGEDYVITENHSIADVLRFLITQCDKSEILFILDNMD